ncbi:hypothetical protein ABGN05_29460 [Aquibium sp. LZ166]|uniref:Uncharacterized protein n=1 Tax=Aquibium pacificus TaxID=3153579 RepID=A0ABV3SSH5_9HYPH
MSIADSPSRPRHWPLTYIFPTSSGLGGRWTTVIYGLFLAGVALWILNYLFLATARHQGDEDNYLFASKVLANWLLQRPPVPTLAKVIDAVVDNGWFMPGMLLVTVPAFIADPLLSAANHIWLWRLNSALLSFAVWIWTLRRVDLLLGQTFTIALLICPTLILGWILFTSTIFGEVVGGLLIAVAFAQAYRLALILLHQDRVDLATILRFELLLLAVVYVRGNAIVLVFAIHVFLAVMVLLADRREFVLRNLSNSLAGVLVFAALLAPWSLLVSSKLGGPVLTTSTLTLSLGITFGGANQICFGPCPGDNTWREAVKFSREYGRAHQISELEAQKLMTDYALRNVTYTSYMKRVAHNFRSFLSTPTAFFDRFASGVKSITDKDVLAALSDLVKYASLAVYVPVILLLLCANVWIVTPRNLEMQVMSLCVKLFTLCIFVQPFLHPSHARYWPLFAPLMGLSAAFLFNLAFARRLGPAGVFPDLAAASVRPRVGTFLLVVQALYSAMFILMAFQICCFLIA